MTDISLGVGSKGSSAVPSGGCSVDDCTADAGLNEEAEHDSGDQDPSVEMNYGDEEDDGTDDDDELEQAAHEEEEEEEDDEMYPGLGGLL